MHIIITYNLFKNSFETETYCKISMPFSQRSSFAKFRCGVAPLRIETGGLPGDCFYSILRFGDI